MLLLTQQKNSSASPSGKSTGAVNGVSSKRVPSAAATSADLQLGGSSQLDSRIQGIEKKIHDLVKMLRRPGVIDIPKEHVDAAMEALAMREQLHKAIADGRHNRE